MNLRDNDVYLLLSQQRDFMNFTVPSHARQFLPACGTLISGTYFLDATFDSDPLGCGWSHSKSDATRQWQFFVRFGPGHLLGQDVLLDWIATRMDVWAFHPPSLRRAFCLHAERLDDTHVRVTYLWIPPDLLLSTKREKVNADNWRPDTDWAIKNTRLGRSVFAYSRDPGGSLVVSTGDTAHLADSEMTAVAFDQALRSLPHA